ncbi:MAG: major capsid family protein [Bryobacteraceae bacterium]
MRQNPHIHLLADRFGIVFPGAVDYRDSQAGRIAADRMLSDAAPTNLAQNPLVTTGNASIPAYLVNFLDPELTRVLTAPNAAVDIFGEAKKGDWTTETAVFPVVESTGEVSSYGDLNNNGLAGANTSFEPRQSYHYQIFTRWGDREMEKMGKAKIDWAAEQNVSAALIFSQFQNKTYFFGVQGLDNFGLLNDPTLPAAIAPLNGVWSAATGLQIWADIQNLFKQLQRQTQSNITMKDNLVLAMDPLTEAYLLTPMQNVYGNATVADLIKKSFPNMQVKTAVQYATASGNLVQMIAPTLQGQKTGYCAFTEKMRAHAIVRDTSATYQKKSGGTWGTIIKIPAAIAQLLGV